MTGDGDWYPSPSEPDPLCSFFFFFFFFLLLKASFSWALSMVCSFISFLSVFLSTYQRVNCQISPWLNSQISRLSCLIELYKCFNDWILINLSTMQFWRAYTWHSELVTPTFNFFFFFFSFFFFFFFLLLSSESDSSSSSSPSSSSSSFFNSSSPRQNKIIGYF